MLQETIEGETAVLLRCLQDESSEREKTERSGVCWLIVTFRGRNANPCRASGPVPCDQTKVAVPSRGVYPLHGDSPPDRLLRECPV
jgi:hypothetical protein